MSYTVPYMDLGEMVIWRLLDPQVSMHLLNSKLIWGRGCPFRLFSLLVSLVSWIN